MSLTLILLFMNRLPPSATRSDTLLPYPTLCRSDTRARTDADGRLDIAVVEGNARAGQPVQDGRLHPWRSQLVDRIEPLLVGHDENDVGLVCHDFPCVEEVR